MANKRNQLFLYATETIPAMIWKDIALGYTNEIPKVLLATFKYNCSSESFRLNNNLFYLMLQAGLTKIVNLYRSKTLSDFDKFVSFLEWYIDNMLISESMIIYAALLFGNVEGVRSPKNVNSKNYEDVVAGIDNQSWDLFYVSEWSSYFYNEDDDGVNFFATDDKTLKYIIVNIFPKNECLTNLSYIFQTKKQHKILTDLFESELGANRVKPFETSDVDKGITISKKLLEEERAVLKEQCT